MIYSVPTLLAGDGDNDCNSRLSQPDDGDNDSSGYDDDSDDDVDDNVDDNVDDVESSTPITSTSSVGTEYIIAVI